MGLSSNARVALLSPGPYPLEPEGAIGLAYRAQTRRRDPIVAATVVQLERHPQRRAVGSWSRQEGVPGAGLQRRIKTNLYVVLIG